MMHSGAFLMNFEVFYLVMKHTWILDTNKMILEGQIKDAEMSSFSSDSQTLIKH